MFQRPGPDGAFGGLRSDQREVGGALEVGPTKENMWKAAEKIHLWWIGKTSRYVWFVWYISCGFVLNMCGFVGFFNGSMFDYQRVCIHQFICQSGWTIYAIQPSMSASGWSSDLDIFCCLKWCHVCFFVTKSFMWIVHRWEVMSALHLYIAFLLDWHLAQGPLRSKSVRWPLAHGHCSVTALLVRINQYRQYIGAVWLVCIYWQVISRRSLLRAARDQWAKMHHRSLSAMQGQLHLRPQILNHLQEQLEVKLWSVLIRPMQSWPRLHQD